jgi:ABC-2 type transport system ATP-binding protein
MAMIRINNLTKYYGDFCAVNNISLEIKKGEVLGLLGPNGAGKTTTLRILTCYMPPTSGTITVGDYNIHDHPLEIKRMIGYLPESAPLYHDMLVYDYLGFVADIRGLKDNRKEERIRELSQTCGLKEVMHRPIGELSKGYKQRVGLAHAMMGDPEILILDEPTSGLDPNQIVEIREIIKRIGRERTVILSTHILSEVEATCDRVVILHRGRIVADDRTEALRTSAGDRRNIRLTLQGAKAEDVSKVLSGIEGIYSVGAGGPEDGAIRFTLTCDPKKDVRADIYRAIKAHDWIILEFYQETRTLESVFRELTGEG